MPKPRTITVPLYDGDDFERITELRRAVNIAEAHAREAQASGTARAGDDGADVQAAKDAFDAFVVEAAERAEMWVLQTIGHEEFRNLLREHPPRKVMVKVPNDDGTERDVEQDHPEDAPFGVNTETFGKALLTFVDPDDDEIRTIAEPEFASEAARRKRFKRLSSGEFDTLWVRAKTLNEGGVLDPKLSMYSTATVTSDET